jgi:2-methylcitrate dehydratase
VEYPIGHRRRRADAVPLLKKKFLSSCENHLPRQKAEQLLALFDDADRLDEMPADNFISALVAGKT